MKITGLDEYAEEGLRTATGFKYYNQDMSAYMTTGTGGFVFTGTLAAAGFATGFTAQASTNLAKNDLVYISSVTAAGVPIVTPAVSNVAGKSAVFVVTDTTILSGAQGTVAVSGLSSADLNTNAATVGDPVYLTTTGTTTNTWTLTEPTAGASNSQVVGHVNVKSLTVGQISFNLLEPIKKVGSTMLQTSAIQGQVVADSQSVAFGTGSDLTIIHDGTNTALTSTTGFLLIDNTNVTGATHIDLGTDTTATQFDVRNNSGTVAFAVKGDGKSFTGNLRVGGVLDSPMTAAQVLGAADTITLPTTGINKALSSAAARTGLILTGGTIAGQIIILMNTNAADSLTFDATPATSNVALSTCVIPAGAAMLFTWNATASRWFPVGA